ncbi:hypothetical protein [Caballeronia sp. LjRoot31]|uniref:hypothetical protein n=1 Tax=Caballeronia sp. LjRoot31 TaxID=3342324 RepID=UPI003ECED006
MPNVASVANASKLLYVTDGDVQTITFQGRTYRFRVNVQFDEHMGEPWKEHDGHGPVSDWTTRDKGPGEWVLANDGSHKRYYDAAEANLLAKRDGWGLADEEQAALLDRLAKPRKVRRVIGKPKRGHRFGGLMRVQQVKTEVVTLEGRDRTKALTRGEIRAEAVRRDFEYLSGWAKDEWHWCGVVVTPLGDDPEMDAFTPIDYMQALWGINDDDDAYIAEVAHELMLTAACEISKESAEAQYWAARGLTTL